MKTIKEIYKIGLGPSSSHTMGPRKAAELFIARHPNAARTEVTLYGSLAATGKGHMTDVAIMDAIPGICIIWEPKVFLPFHPNGMEFRAYAEDGTQTDNWQVFSIGGGELAEESKSRLSSPDIYKLDKMTDILKYCERTGKSYWEYVAETEGSDIWDYLQTVWETMKAAVERGLDAEGVLPGPLNLRRKAAAYYVKATGYKDNLRTRGLVFSYALAVSEENAAGGKIVTAPTCGSCGVLPGVLYHMWKSKAFSDARILRALATAGLIGNVVKHNGTVRNGQDTFFRADDIRFFSEHFVDTGNGSSG